MESKRKILVAGAGHGGLTAAIRLARAGYDVTVIEAKQRTDCGYDWHDVTRKSVFDDIGTAIPENGYVMPYYRTVFTNPRKTVKVNQIRNSLDDFIVTDRKYLLALLLEEAKKAGAKTVFGTTITGAVTDGKKVIGLMTDTGNFYGDLVIDSAGVHSPVRRSLPSVCGIRNEIPADSLFYTYRAYYVNCSGRQQNPLQTTYFYHNYRPGMDWLITEKDFVDVLVGGFSPIDMKDVADALTSMRSDFPDMGTDCIRGGSFAVIPLCIPLEKFVCDGYAAVGDCAAMTEPMSGSGIHLSIRAGKILADTIIGLGGQAYSLAALWQYQYRYMKECGTKSFGSGAMKKMLAKLDGKNIDYLFEHDILTAGVMRYKGISHDTPAEICRKILYLIPKPRIVFALLQMMYHTSHGKKAKKRIPETYSEKEYAKWVTVYRKI